MDRPEQEAFFRACKQQHTNGTRYVGILNIDDESELARLDAMGLDGVVHRPVNESNLVATVNHLLPNSYYRLTIYIDYNMCSCPFRRVDRWSAPRLSDSFDGEQSIDDGSEDAASPIIWRRSRSCRRRSRDWSRNCSCATRGNGRRRRTARPRFQDEIEAAAAPENVAGAAGDRAVAGGAGQSRARRSVCCWMS